MVEFEDDLVERGGALRVRVEPRAGQWWVVFEVTSARDGYITRRMIRPYTTQRAARIAARWMRRGADRYPDPGIQQVRGEPYG